MFVGPGIGAIIDNTSLTKLLVYLRTTANCSPLLFLNSDPELPIRCEPSEFSGSLYLINDSMYIAFPLNSAFFLQRDPFSNMLSGAWSG